MKRPWEKGSKMTVSYQLESKDGVKAVVTITASNITGAEQNVVILDEQSKPVAVIEMQPGIDHKEL
jgi:VCBS repeat-containing protein